MDTSIWTPTTLTGGNNIPGSESSRERMKNKRGKKIKDRYREKPTVKR